MNCGILHNIKSEHLIEFLTIWQDKPTFLGHANEYMKDRIFELRRKI